MLSTQGTQVFFIDPADDTVHTLECPTGLTIPGVTRDQLEILCLDDTTGVRRFRQGAGTPGVVTVSANFDPASASHVRLLELQDTGETIEWVVGLSDGTSLPLVDTAGLVDLPLPSDRSWVHFEGSLSDAPIDAQVNTFYTVEFSVQMSGPRRFFPKSTP